MTNASQPSKSSQALAANATSGNSLPTSWVEKIFQRMVGYYGVKFADAWAGSDPAIVKAIWAEELAAYTVDEIRRGLDTLRQCKWPPTLPEFLMLCRPRPDYQAAYAEACRLIGSFEGWSDCSVFWAAREVGYHDLKAMRYQDIAGRWRDAFDRAWANRRPIPERAPVAGLVTASPTEAPVSLTPEQRAALFERIKGIGK